MRACGAARVRGQYPPKIDPWSRCRARCSVAFRKKSDDRDTNQANTFNPQGHPPLTGSQRRLPACPCTNPAACPCADNDMALYSLFKLTVLCALFHEAAAAVRRQPPRHTIPVPCLARAPLLRKPPRLLDPRTLSTRAFTLGTPLTDALSPHPGHDHDVHRGPRPLDLFQRSGWHVHGP